MAGIDVSTIHYAVKATSVDGTTLDLTPVVSNLGWEEGTREIAVRVSLRIADCDVNGKRLSSLIVPGTPLSIMATLGGQQSEVCAAIVERWSFTDSNSDSTIELEAYDQAHALTKSEDYAYFSPGHSTGQMLGAILGKWDVPFNYTGPDIGHNKTTFKRQNIADMVQRILDDVKKKSGAVLFVRWKDNQLDIIERGTNSDVYQFTSDSNTVTAKDSLDMSELITRVLIVGKSDKEGHQAVLATVDGKTEFGIRQLIIEHEKSKDLSESRTAADEALKEHGSLQRTSSIDVPDVPTVRKGDKVSVKAGTLDGTFYVRAIRHNAADHRMSLDLDPCEANGDANQSYEGGGRK